MNTKWIGSVAATSLLATLAGAQVVPDAGPDDSVTWGDPYSLQSSVLNRSLLHYILADGDHATENDFLEYRSDVGVTVIAQPSTMGGILYNWPSDIVRIGGLDYVIDTGKRQLYTVDLTTSVATQVGSPLPPGSYEWMTCLAYDTAAGKLYGVDGLDKQLLEFNVNNGNVTPVGNPLTTGGQPYWFIKGLAYDEVNDILVAVDGNTETLLTIDQHNNAATQHVVNLPAGPDALYDEIQFFNGELYGSFRYFDNQTQLWNAQLRRIDPATGLTEDVGPPVLDISAHALMILGIPEDVEWLQLAGPGTATFSDATIEAPTVTFSDPGVYTLELTVYTDMGPVSDTVDVTVDAGVATYCVGKTTSQGCVPFLTHSGTPSATSTGKFQIQGENFLEGEIGILLYGLNGRGSLDFHGGKLCVKAPVTRLLPPKLAKGSFGVPCTGVVKRDFNQRIQSGIDPLLTPGRQVNAQWRLRDPLDLSGFTDALSDGIEFTILP